MKPENYNLNEDKFLKEKNEIERKIILLRNELKILEEKYFEKYLKEGD